MNEATREQGVHCVTATEAVLQDEFDNSDSVQWERQHYFRECVNSFIVLGILSIARNASCCYRSSKKVSE